jgi:endo-1,4-beta-xylanase
MENDSAFNKHLFAAWGFPVGCSVKSDRLLNSEEYRQIAFTEFSSFTPENAFKPSVIHPEEGLFDFKHADDLVDLAARSGKRIHGHTLVWSHDIPPWMERFRGDKQRLTEILISHVTQVVSRYKSRVSSWDVVNEAFNEDGSMNENLWRSTIGDEYIQLAFSAAAEADPGALLFYNDNLMEVNSVKRLSVIDHLNLIRRNNVRVDGIGMQCHISVAKPSQVNICEAIQSVASSNYLLHISELDISTGAEPDVDTLQFQARRYCDIFKACNKVLPELCHGITLWGISDADSWIRHVMNVNDHPLLFDENYRPKPAYHALLSACHGSNPYL